MHAAGHYMDVRRGHQKRSFRLQRAFRQRGGHLFHGTDGYGKAEYVSGFGRYPRSGAVRIVWNSHGLMNMQREHYGRDSLSPSYAGMTFSGSLPERIP